MPLDQFMLAMSQNLTEHLRRQAMSHLTAEPGDVIIIKGEPCLVMEIKTLPPNHCCEQALVTHNGHTVFRYTRNILPLP